MAVRGADRQRRLWDPPSRAYLYEDPTAPTLRLADVAAYLRETLGMPVERRPEFFVHHAAGGLEDLARAIAITRVRSVERPFEPIEPLYGEVQFELRLLRNPERRVGGVLYDGYQYTQVLRGLLPTEERRMDVLHIAFSYRLPGTFGEDGRYHARAVICSIPSLVSTSGLVEAPAKPEAYYRLKAQLSAALGSVPFEAAKEPFEGQFLDYDDPRLTEVAKGYALQCAMYQITKEPFCDIPRCRLFNAHWQAELLAAQLESGCLCPNHAQIAKSISTIVRQRARGKD